MTRKEWLLVAAILLLTYAISWGCGKALADTPLPNVEYAMVQKDTLAMHQLDGWTYEESWLGHDQVIISRPVPPTMRERLTAMRGQVFKMLGTGANTATVEVSIEDFDALLSMIDAAQGMARQEGW